MQHVSFGDGWSGLLVSVPSAGVCFLCCLCVCVCAAALSCHCVLDGSSPAQAATPPAAAGPCKGDHACLSSSHAATDALLQMPPAQRLQPVGARMLPMLWTVPCCRLSARSVHGCRLSWTSTWGESPVSTSVHESCAGKSPDAFCALLRRCAAMLFGGRLDPEGLFAAMQQMGGVLHAVSGGWAPQVEMTHACRRYALQAIDAQAQADALRERLREVGDAQQWAWVQHQRWARLCEQPYSGTMLYKCWETYLWSQRRDCMLLWW